jgi:hypothetical protein
MMLGFGGSVQEASMRRFVSVFSVSVFALLVVFSVSAAAHADTLSTFSLNDAVYVNGATATGSVVIDVTTGAVQSGSFDFTLNSVSSIYDVPGVHGNGFDGGTQSYFDFLDSIGEDIDFDVALPSFVGYSGGALCTSVNPCPGGYRSTQYPLVGAENNLLSGSFSLDSGTSPGVTPEPSSILLLLTGVAGMCAMMRYRFARA